MPLETGDHIPELDANNPLGSDAVSLGDDHLRLIKRAVLGSFPAFVGTTATPKSVTLTEDQINDAALKSETQTIAGAWDFDGSAEFNTAPILNNNIHLTGRNVALSGTLNLVGLDTADRVILGNSTSQQINFCATQNQFLVDGVTVGFMVALNSGGIQVKDRLTISKKTGFRNPTRHVTNANSDALQDWEGSVVALNTGSTRVNFLALESLTQFDIINASGIGFADQGAGMTLSRFDGTARIDGNFTMTSGSVWHFYQITATIWYCWELT